MPKRFAHPLKIWYAYTLPSSDKEHPMNTLVESTLHPTDNGKVIAILTLNNPKALNAQNLAMVQATRTLLDAWATDDAVAMIVIRGAEDRAMCAGGDIKSLYSADSGDNVYDFFDNEYGLMHKMHTYPKPIVAWGNGIVMGGGLGLFCASSHKVVTESTLMAMPEVSIGLFPDAGASYFLPRLADRLGLFLGLTGMRFSGADAVDICLADYGIRHDEFDRVIDTLAKTEFGDDNAQNYCSVSDCLLKLSNSASLPKGQLIKNLDIISKLMTGDDLQTVDKNLHAYDGQNADIQTAIDNYHYGSNITKALTWHIYHTVKNAEPPMSLSDIFAMETKVAVNCVTKGDFKEGVRALLIDKDKNPQWQYSSINDIPQEFIDGFFN